MSAWRAAQVMSGLMGGGACYAPVDASGLAVGLPEGVMGNSEVGHLTIGAGQAQYQDLVRINLALKDGTFNKQANLAVRPWPTRTLPTLPRIRTTLRTASASPSHYLCIPGASGIRLCPETPLAVCVGSGGVDIRGLCMKRVE